jgi:hypothetical protein
MEQSPDEMSETDLRAYVLKMQELRKAPQTLQATINREGEAMEVKGGKVKKEKVSKTPLDAMKFL